MTYPNNITDLYQSICQIQSLGLPLRRCARSQLFTFTYFKEKVLTVLYLILFLHTFLRKGQTQASAPSMKSSNKVETKLRETNEKQSAK